MDVKVLGTGCANCRALETATREALDTATREALDATGADATVQKVEEMAEIVGYGVMGLPALVVDGEVVLAGRVPDPDELTELLVAAD